MTDEEKQKKIEDFIERGNLYNLALDYINSLNRRKTMKLNFQVNTQKAAEMTQSYKPIPAGEYDVKVKFAEIVETKSGKPAVKVCFVVDGPTHKGRTIYDWFVDPENNEISANRLSALCVACDITENLTDENLSKLEGKIFSAYIKINKNDTSRNDIGGFKKSEKKDDDLPF